MLHILILAAATAVFLPESEACANPEGFHCPTNGSFLWNCPLPFKNTIDRWRCYEDHCCWCRDEGTNFRRLCKTADLAFISEQRPILVNPNFNCNYCNPGTFCTYQEDVGLPGPENGCSRGRLVNGNQQQPQQQQQQNRFVANNNFQQGRKKRSHQAQAFFSSITTVDERVYDIKDMI